MRRRPRNRPPRFRPPPSRVFLAGALALLAFVSVPAARAVPPVDVELVTEAVQALYVTHAGDERLFIVQRDGRILVFTPGSDQPPTLFLDISPLVDPTGNGGLYTAAFHPDYATNGRFFVSYTERGGFGVRHRSVIARYEVSAADPDIANPASGVVLLRYAQAFTSHNNGQIAFGPRDGMLYIGSGDGGGLSDCEAQVGGHLLGKILRIDVDQGADVPPYYSIPADNPFADPLDGIADETWARGLRNPWRFSFDRKRGDLFIGDVGERLKEEIDLQHARSRGGENYGWRVMEGTACNSPDPAAAGCPAGTPPCFDPSYALPIFEYDTGADCAVTGGYLYRGEAIPGLHGKYVFGDVCSARLWALEETPDGQWVRTQIGDASGVTSGFFPLTSFGEDRDAELYATLTNDVYRLVYAGAPVEIDVRPFSRKNWIWTPRFGLLWVAVLGSDDLDVADVETGTLVFGPADAVPSKVISTIGRRRPRPVDVNRDGRPDLLLAFRAREVGVSRHDDRLCLEGSVGDTPFAACDRVRVIGGWWPRRPHAHR